MIFDLQNVFCLKSFKKLAENSRHLCLLRLVAKSVLIHKYPQNLWTYYYIKRSQRHLLAAIENN